MPVRLKFLGLALHPLCFDLARMFDFGLTRLVGPWFFPPPRASPLPPYLLWSAPWLLALQLDGSASFLLLHCLVALLSWHGSCRARRASPPLFSVHIDVVQRISTSGGGGAVGVEASARVAFGSARVSLVVLDRPVGVETSVRASVGVARVCLSVLDRLRLCKPVRPVGPPCRASWCLSCLVEPQL